MSSCVSFQEKFLFALLFPFLCSVGEPINAEAWHWYNEVVGEKRCVIVDTWWQTGENNTDIGNQSDQFSLSVVQLFYH